MSSDGFIPSRQVIVHQMLVAARKTVLLDALSEALGKLDPATVKREIGELVPADVQRILAAAGIRDEHVFPVPAVLQLDPKLVAYYRLLIGVSQKRFYRKGTGMGPYGALEKRGVINAKNPPDLDYFCSAMSRQLAAMVRQFSPPITGRDISELPLLTLGAQLYGSNNNTIGKQATQDVFLAVGEIVKAYVATQDERKITVFNASSRKVVIALAGDPDIRIQEEFEGRLRNKVAIEIKGAPIAAMPIIGPVKPRNRIRRRRGRASAIIGQSSRLPGSMRKS